MNVSSAEMSLSVTHELDICQGKIQLNNDDIVGHFQFHAARRFDFFPLFNRFGTWPVISAHFLQGPRPKWGEHVLHSKRNNSQQESSLFISCLFFRGNLLRQLSYGKHLIISTATCSTIRRFLLFPRTGDPSGKY